MFKSALLTLPFVGACGLFLNPSEDVFNVQRDAGVVDVGDFDVQAFDAAHASDAAQNVDVVETQRDVQGVVDAGDVLPDVEREDVSSEDVFVPVVFNEPDLAFSFEGHAENAVISTGSRPKFYGRIEALGERFVRLANASQGVSEASIVLPPTPYSGGESLEHFSFCATLDIDALTTTGSLYQLGTYPQGIELRAEFDGRGPRLVLRHHIVIGENGDHDFFSAPLELGLHAFCLNFDGTDVRLMVDGVATLLERPENHRGAAPLLLGSDDHRILARSAGAVNVFNGRLDDVRVWFNQLALSDAEMRSVGEQAVSKPGPVFDLPIAFDDALDAIQNRGVADIGNAFGEFNARLENVDSRFAIDMRNDGQNIEFDNIAPDDPLLGQNVAYHESTFALWIYSEGTDGVVYQFGSDPNCVKLSLFDHKPRLNGTLGGTRFGLVIHEEEITPNTWTHLALTLSPEAIKLYLNGVERASGTGIERWQMVDQANDGLLRIGSDIGLDCSFNNGERGFLSAALDNIRFYPHALSPDEINQDLVR